MARGANSLDGVVERLVTGRSEDGYHLDGVLFQPAREVRPVTVLIVPGLYAAFYDAPYPALGRALAARGVRTLAGNTRGHDFGAVLRRSDGTLRPGGGGWERLAECVHDIGGWLTMLDGSGVRSVALLGHSLGARKAAYYLAHRADPRAVALVAASPAVAPVPPPDGTIMALARRMEAEGRGRDLLPWPEIGCSMSARAYLDHEQPDGAFLNIFARNVAGGPAPLVERVTCPILAFFGALERRGEPPDRSGELATLRRHAVAARRVDTAMITDAGHLYDGREAAVAVAVAGWLDSLVKGGDVLV